MRLKTSVWAIVVLAALAALVAVPAATTAPSVFPLAESQGFRKAVTVPGIRAHQQALQTFATANGGSRVSGTGGFDDSAQYVYDTMAAAGYDVSFQEFTFNFTGDQTPPTFERTSAPAATFVDGVDFATMTNSGSGDATASVTAVDLIVPSPAANASTSGCEAADFAGFPVGSFALMQRGTCAFRD